jgi:uncharacterized membrane protein
LENAVFTLFSLEGIIMSLHFQSVIDDIDQDCDIAAGINEDGLNHFLATHHTVNYNPSDLSIYRGVGKV